MVQYDNIHLFCNKGLLLYVYCAILVYRGYLVWSNKPWFHFLGIKRVYINIVTNPTVVFFLISFWQMRLLSTIICHLACIACRLAITGISDSISFLYMKAPGEVERVHDTAHCVACIAKAEAISINAFASIMSFGTFECNKVSNTSPTVWCICSQMAFKDSGFCGDILYSMLL